MIWGPLAISSPGVPSGTSTPLSSTILTSVEETGNPMYPRRAFLPNIFTVSTGDDSVIPYPSLMRQPVTDSHLSATAF